MSLSRHVDPDEIITKARSTRQSNPKTHYGSTAYSSRYTADEEIPKFKIPDSGTSAQSAYQLIHDELEFDGRPNLNLASFVNTFMEPEVDKLIMENINKNLADADEYPAMMDIHTRCISMLSHLWKIPKGETAVGSATTGSSEAIQLGGLAMKRRWQEKRMKEGKDHSKPNIIMGSNAQVALEKFARYFEVEARILPVSKESNYCLDPKLIRSNVDENTIGIFIILGSTYTGHFEPVAEIAQILDEYEKETGLDIPIHVDGASGAMIAPFVYPDLKWSFEIPRVKSINTSGHKYGLTYVGLGWIIWRGQEYLPKHLVFELHYLGGTEESYTLNFSRPGNQMIAQYFTFLHLGFEGFRKIQSNDLFNARVLSRGLEESGYFECISSIHIKSESWKDGLKGLVHGEDPNQFVPGLPVVAFKFSQKFRQEFPQVKQASLSTLLRVKGWILPNYPLPPNEEKEEILRVVVRESFSLDLCERLIRDIIHVTETLMDSDAVDMEALSRGMSGLTSIKSSVEKERRGSTGEESKQKGKETSGHDPLHRFKGIFARGTC
eukprot:TRINITY_DN1583_c0_g1_i1.p1 TRINITY_DN1583_c0_g1~~TRINITY_DN1583_c0_g1_i1.p1  ORF type:complete len:551 (-),score=192.84 TRINITY_DN1583_c0_g1_i1:52-1704(-)